MLSDKQGGETMPVEDDRRYDEWSKALDDLKEANDRYREATRTGSDTTAAKSDLRRAQDAYDKISNEIDSNA